MSTTSNKPTCRKCKKRACRYYGAVGGYSVQCKKCNELQSERRRAASKRRRDALSQADTAHKPTRPWDIIKHDPSASPLEREASLLQEWNQTLRELRRLESEIVQTLNENAHLADGDDCTLIRLKRAVGWK